MNKDVADTAAQRRWAKEIFLDALVVPAMERPAFVEQRCGDDAELRRMVSALLHAHTQADGMFGPAPEIGGADDGAMGQGARAGDRVGPYRLLRKLGEGGFGVVFLAEQEAPLVRQVAIKLLKTAESTQVVERFRLERETLARMDHPGIARVLDAGTSAQQQPWVAIEFVDGLPITDHCDTHRLPLRSRLELFEAVCLAVQHAHHKGVVHRDLKPGNVLVAHVDGRPSPKVIDFGIAKAVGDDGLATLTLAHQVIGTPEYMAPEQATGTAGDIDTRADVYSLGVLLYRLLCGASPYDSERLARAGLLAWSRAICEGHTPRPSTRLRAAAGAPAIAAARATTLDRLARDLSGELDWIVLKAMQKDRARRYPTASALAADVRRYLEQQPVEAGPPSALYRLRKLCQRHWLAAVALVLASIAVMTGAVLSTMWAMAATRARQLAEEHSYSASLYAADAALRRCETREARRRLAAAPSQLRGIEWDLLAARVDRSLVSHALPGKRAEAMASRGRTVAIADGDGELRAFDGATGALRARAAGLAAPVRELALDHDGDHVFCGTADGRVVRWRVADGQRVEAHHDDAVESIHLVDGDRRVVTGALDATVRVWDAITLAPLAALPQEAPVLHVRCSPDGRRLAVATWDETLSIWDLASRQRLLRTRLARTSAPTEHPRFRHGNVNAVEFSPDGSKIAVGLRDGRLAVLDADGNVLWSRDEHERLVRDVAWSADGTRLACAGRDHRATLWSVAGELLGEMAHTADVRAVAFRPDGEVLVTASFDSSLRLFSGRRGTPLGELLGHEDAVYDVAFAANGNRIWSYAGDCQVRVWHPQAALDDARPLLAWCLAIQFTPGGRLIAGDVFGALHVVERPEQLTPVRVDVGLGAKILALSVSPADGTVACALENGEVGWVTADTATLARRVAAHAAPVKAVAFVAGGRVLASASEDRTVRLWHASTGAALADIAPMSAPVRELTAWGERHVVAADRDGEILICDAERGVEVRRFVGVASGPEAMAVHPQQPVVAVGSLGDIVLFDLERGQPLRTLRGHDDEVTALAWRPDGSRLVSASRDGTVRIWDAAREDALLTLRGDTAPLHTLAISSDGHRIAACGEAGVLRTWSRAARGAAR